MRMLRPKIMNRFYSAASGLLAAGLMMAGGTATALDSPALTLARQLNDAFIQVADSVSPAVVVIDVTEKPDTNSNDDPGSFWDFHHHHGHSQRQRKMEGEGSGIVITPDGYILTNAHVVDNAEKIDVLFQDGRSFTGEVKGADPQSDVAVIKINAKGLKAAKLGDSDATRVGEFVVAIGAPFQLSYSVTVGHVSAKGRSFETGADQDFIQTDASINPGNSGGPLVNLYGEVIALNAMIEGMNTGIGFAIPINLAKRVADHLIAEGKFTRSWLGVGIDNLRGNPDYQSLDSRLAPGVEDGVVIANIVAGGPAAKSDLQPGDVVISVDGKTVKTARQLKDAISLQKPGRVVSLGVVRLRDHLIVKATTAPFPISTEMAQSSHPSGDEAESQTFGLTVQAVTRELAQQYGVEPSSGVIVTAVDEDSPAADQSIQVGDIITRINRKQITSPKQFLQAIKGADSKRGMTVNLISEGSSRFLILKDSGQ
jgi:serine protease Do